MTKGNSGVGIFLPPLGHLQMEAVDIGQYQMANFFNQPVGDPLVLQHLSDLPPGVPPHRTQSHLPLQRMELTVVQPALQRLLPKPHRLHWLRQPVDLHRQEMQHPARNRHHVLYLGRLHPLPVDLQTEQRQQHHQNGREPLFEILRNEHGAQEGQEELQSEEIGREETDRDEHVDEFLDQEHALLHHQKICDLLYKGKMKGKKFEWIL